MTQRGSDWLVVPETGIGAITCAWLRLEDQAPGRRALVVRNAPFSYLSDLALCESLRRIVPEKTGFPSGIRSPEAFMAPAEVNVQ